MLCRISDLLVEVPETGDLPQRCREYLHPGSGQPDVVIRAEDYRRDRYPEGTEEWLISYLESGVQYLRSLLFFDGMYLHCSAVELDGRAYLFSGPCGMGKSTHARLWQDIYPKATVINDDKPALRYLDGVWYAYGTPWCGKDGINVNKKVPIAGICFLKQGSENRIRRLDHQEAVPHLLSQTIHRFSNPERLDLMLTQLGKLVQKIPIYELVNRPEPAAAQLSYETMCRIAQEAGL